MKTHFLFRSICFLFFSFAFNQSFSQTSYITKKDGEKIIVDDNKIEFLFPDKFEYQLLNSDKKIKINLKKIKTAVLNKYHIETFTIDNKEKPCFVMAILNDKKLVGYSQEINTSSINRSSTSIIHYNYILDRNNNMVEKIQLDRFFNDPKQKNEQAESILRKHFSDCPSLMARIKEFDLKEHDFTYKSERLKKYADRADEGNIKMIYLFNNPKYSDCSEIIAPTIIKNPVSKDDLEAKLKDIKGKYNYGAMSANINGRNMEMSMKGSVLIENGYIYFETKYTKIKYPIVSFEDEVLKCSEKDMIHSLKIVSESGKKKGFNYTTRITFITDKRMSDTAADYWSVKE